MERLHFTENDEKCDSSCEIGSSDDEGKFAIIIARHIVSALKIDYASQDIVYRLLSKSLEDVLKKRDGLLEQYLHTQLDRIADTIRARYSVDDDVKVNYNYAAHAKLNDLIKAAIEDN